MKWLDSSSQVATQLELGFSFTASASAPNTESFDDENGFTQLSLRAVSGPFLFLLRLRTQSFPRSSYGSAANSALVLR